MKSVAITVGTTPVTVIAADNKERVCYLHSGTGSVYIGNSAVTSSTGIHLPNGTTMEIVVPANETLHAVTASSSQTMVVLTPDVD